MAKNIVFDDEVIAEPVAVSRPAPEPVPEPAPEPVPEPAPVLRTGEKLIQENPDLPVHKGVPYDEVIDVDAFTKEYKLKGERVLFDRDNEAARLNEKAAKTAELDALKDVAGIVAYLKKKEELA